MPGTPWTWTTEEVLPSDLRAGHRFLDRVLKQLAQERWSDHDLFSVRLAMEEALVNAIKHGNRLDRNKVVRVFCKLSPTRIIVEIADEGAGFQPEDVPDPTLDENLERPSGRGLMLMRNFMSRVEYNETGNHVVMEKRRGRVRPS